jgi:uncharacterized protein (DUF433 family)
MNRPTMLDDRLLLRITVQPAVLGGKPCVRGMRIPVELVIAMLAQGATVAEIIDGYPELEPDDIRACLLYAYRILRGEPVEAGRLAPA